MCVLELHFTVICIKTMTLAEKLSFGKIMSPGKIKRLQNFILFA